MSFVSMIFHGVHVNVKPFYHRNVFNLYLGGWLPSNYCRPYSLYSNSIIYRPYRAMVTKFVCFYQTSWQNFPLSDVNFVKRLYTFKMRSIIKKPPCQSRWLIEHYFCHQTIWKCCSKALYPRFPRTSNGLLLTAVFLSQFKAPSPSMSGGLRALHQNCT